MKPVYLLDTNIISEIVKINPNKTIIKKIAETDGLCSICATVWQEAVFGYERMPEGKKKERINEYLQKIFKTYDIIPYESFAARICAEIRSRCEATGKTLPYSDSQIAATAIANNMILITHNTEDYEPLLESTMLKVEDWWE